MSTPTDTGYVIGTTTTLTKFLIGHLASHPMGMSLDPLAELLLDNGVQPGIDPIQTLRDAKEALWCELGAQLRNGNLVLVWMPKTAPRWTLAKNEEYVRTHINNPNAVFVSKSQIPHNNRNEVAWTQIATEVVKARGTLGLTNREFWELFWPFHVECQDNTPAAFAWVFSYLKNAKTLSAVSTGAGKQKRYFYGNGHNGNGHQVEPIPVLPPTPAEPVVPQPAPIEPVIVESTPPEPVEEVDLYETFTNVTSLKVQSGIISVDRDFDPSITVRFCLGCPPDKDSLYLPGFSTISLVQEVSSPNGRKRFVSVDIEEPFSLSLQVLQANEK